MVSITRSHLPSPTTMDTSSSTVKNSQAERTAWILWPLTSLKMALVHTLRVLSPFRILQLVLEALDHIMTAMQQQPDRHQKVLAWLRDTLPETRSRDVHSLSSLWQDGSLLCALVHAVVPGSIPDSSSVPYTSLIHGQLLVSKYLGVPAAFTEDELKESVLSASLEHRLLRYLLSVRDASMPLLVNAGSSNHSEQQSESLWAIPRGMGLVTAVQGRRAVFYLYLLDRQQADHFVVQIHGPDNDFGSAFISTVLETDLRRARSTSFTLKPWFSTSRNSNIPIEHKLNPGSVSVSYIPQSEGSHELSVMRRGCHLVGSPFMVKVDKSGRHVTEDSKWISKEEEERRHEMKKRLKVSVRIVDFVTEKMILTDDGKLTKLTFNNPLGARTRSMPDMFSASQQEKDIGTGPYPGSCNDIQAIEKLPAEEVERDAEKGYTMTSEYSFSGNSIHASNSISYPSNDFDAKNISSADTCDTEKLNEEMTKHDNKSKYKTLPYLSMKSRECTESEKSEKTNEQKCTSWRNMKSDLQNKASDSVKTCKKSNENIARKYRNVITLCNYLMKNSPRQKSIEILSAAERVLDGRPVRICKNMEQLLKTAMGDMLSEVTETSEIIEKCQSPIPSKVNVNPNNYFENINLESEFNTYDDVSPTSTTKSEKKMNRKVSFMIPPEVTLGSRSENYSRRRNVFCGHKQEKIPSYINDPPGNTFQNCMQCLRTELSGLNIISQINDDISLESRDSSVTVRQFLPKTENAHSSEHNTKHSNVSTLKTDSKDNSDYSVFDVDPQHSKNLAFQERNETESSETRHISPNSVHEKQIHDQLECSRTNSEFPRSHMDMSKLTTSTEIISSVDSKVIENTEINYNELVSCNQTGVRNISNSNSDCNDRKDSLFESTSTNNSNLFVHINNHELQESSQIMDDQNKDDSKYSSELTQEEFRKENVVDDVESTAFYEEDTQDNDGDNLSQPQLRASDTENASEDIFLHSVSSLNSFHEDTCTTTFVSLDSILKQHLVQRSGTMDELDHRLFHAVDPAPEYTSNNSMNESDLSVPHAEDLLDKCENNRTHEYCNANEEVNLKECSIIQCFPQNISENPRQVQNANVYVINRNSDRSDSDYVSMEDARSSQEQTPENQQNDELGKSYNDVWIWMRNSEYIGPAEREIWDVMDDEENTTEGEWTNGLLRFHPRVLTPGILNLECISEETEDNAAHTLHYRTTEHEKHDANQHFVDVSNCDNNEVDNTVLKGNSQNDEKDDSTLCTAMPLEENQVNVFDIETVEHIQKSRDSYNTPLTAINEHNPQAVYSNKPTDMPFENEWNEQNLNAKETYTETFSCVEQIFRESNQSLAILNEQRTQNARHDREVGDYLLISDEPTIIENNECSTNQIYTKLPKECNKANTFTMKNYTSPSTGNVIKSHTANIPNNHDIALETVTTDTGASLSEFVNSSITQSIPPTVTASNTVDNFPPTNASSPESISITTEQLTKIPESDGDTKLVPLIIIEDTDPEYANRELALNAYSDSWYNETTVGDMIEKEFHSVIEEVEQREDAYLTESTDCNEHEYRHQLQENCTKTFADDTSNEQFETNKEQMMYIISENVSDYVNVLDQELVCADTDGMKLVTNIRMQKDETLPGETIPNNVIPTKARVTHWRQYWDILLSEHKRKEGPQKTIKKSNFHLEYLRNCSSPTPTLKKRRSPSIRIPGIVSKWRQTFERVISENRENSNSLWTKQLLGIKSMHSTRNRKLFNKELFVQINSDEHNSSLYENHKQSRETQMENKKEVPSVTMGNAPDICQQLSMSGTVEKLPEYVNETSKIELIGKENSLIECDSPSHTEKLNTSTELSPEERLGEESMTTVNQVKLRKQSLEQRMGIKQETRNEKELKDLLRGKSLYVSRCKQFWDELTRKNDDTYKSIPQKSVSNDASNNDDDDNNNNDISDDNMFASQIYQRTNDTKPIKTMHWSKPKHVSDIEMTQSRITQSCSHFKKNNLNVGGKTKNVSPTPNDNTTTADRNEVPDVWYRATRVSIHEDGDIPSRSSTLIDRCLPENSNYCEEPIKETDSESEQSTKDADINNTAKRISSVFRKGRKSPKVDQAASEKGASRSRFESAKLFFHVLEQSTTSSVGKLSLNAMTRSRISSTDLDESECGPNEIEKTRRRRRRQKVWSEPASDTESLSRVSGSKVMNQKIIGGSQRLKVSERFHVRDLFNDVAGDVQSGFRGIPHRQAVLAALRSVDDDSRPVSPYNCSDEEQEHPVSPIPQYQTEYPYLPITPPSQYRPRNTLQTNTFITRQDLINKE